MLADPEMNETDLLAAIVLYRAETDDLKAIRDYGGCLQTGIEPPLRITQKFIPALYRCLSPSMREKLRHNPRVDEYENIVAVTVSSF
jgi:hypothetical protein